MKSNGPSTEPCEDATFSSIFDRKGRFEIGLLLTRSLGSSCVFLMRGLITANLKVLGTYPNDEINKKPKEDL